MSSIKGGASSNGPVLGKSIVRLKVTWIQAVIHNADSCGVIKSCYIVMLAVPWAAEPLHN